MAKIPVLDKTPVYIRVEGKDIIVKMCSTKKEARSFIKRWKDKGYFYKENNRTP